jgi:deoxycytidine triphosphate deaminase
MKMKQDKSDATTVAAQAKYETYRDKDPFPEIEAALLNSADVFDYINTIGMVSPFDIDQLKGVILSLRVGDSAIYFDKNKTKIRIDIKNSGEFILKSNSIAYVQIFEEIRLPAYIIARFNLRVTNAYRGILLGTGPIVDPGFEGSLYIPLHNLTNNDYVFGFEEPFIDMEFTKLSKNKKWNAQADEGKSAERKGEYRKWEPRNDNINPEKRNIDYYLRRANQGGSIQSSLPPLVENTRVAVSKVEKISDRVDTSLSRINVGLLFSFAALLTAIIAIVNIFRGDIKEFKDKKLDERIHNIEQIHEKDSILIDSLHKIFHL